MRMYYSEEARERAMRERTVIAGVSMMLGLGMGMILALLFAPESGEETREEIADQAGGALDGLNDRIGKLQDSVDSLRREAENRVEKWSN